MSKFKEVSEAFGAAGQRKPKYGNRNITRIGLAGPKYVGKSTVAEELVKMVFGQVYTVSFAQPMRAGLSAMGLNVEDYDRDKGEPKFWGKSYRDLMIVLGSSMREEISNDFWVDLALDYVRSLEVEKSGCPTIIIDDVRFENEADKIRGFDSILKSAVFELRRNGVSYDYSHATEMGLPEDRIDQTLHMTHHSPRTVASMILDKLDAMDDQHLDKQAEVA